MQKIAPPYRYRSAHAIVSANTARRAKLGLSYTFDGELDTDATKELGYKGFTLDVSSSFNSDAFFLHGQSTSYTTSDEELLLPDTDVTIFDWTSIGPGIHHTSQVGGMDLDLWGQFTLNRAAFIAVATKGVGAALGHDSMLPLNLRRLYLIASPAQIVNIVVREPSSAYPYGHLRHSTI